MTGSLARYHARSPRYVLDTQDNNLIRYSGAERLTWEEKTVLRNVSLTGLSFSAPTDLSPQLGEIVKIQFQVPHAEMMACYGVVIRIQEIDEFENEIAVHFYKLDRVQRINLVQGLAQKMESEAVKIKKTPFKKQHSVYPYLMVFSMITAVLCWITILKKFWL